MQAALTRLELSAKRERSCAAGQLHRLSNQTKEHLLVIEVQTGKYLEEDDITRYGDEYDRL